MFFTPLCVDLESLCVELSSPPAICGPRVAICGPDSTHNKAPTRKTPIFRDNHHKNKAIFYGGLRGGAVCEKYQQNQEQTSP